MSPEDCGPYLDYPYLQNNFYLTIYYIIIPTTLVFGFVGNIACLRIVVKKFLKEHGFQYQVVIICFDLLANVTTTIIVVLVHWGEQTLLVPGPCKKFTAFWSQYSYALVRLSTFGTAFNGVFVGMAPFLLFGSALDRCFALLKPIYYKFEMPKRTVLAVVALIGLLLNTTSAIRLLMGFEIVATKLNGTEAEAIVVYKVKRNLVPEPWGEILGVFISIRGFLGIALFITASVVLSVAYRKKDPNSAANKAESGAVGSNANAPISSVLLSRLLLAQCFLVFLGNVPEVVQGVLFYYGFPMTFGEPYSLMNLVIVTKVLCGAIQVSLNVVAYSSVSPRFRREVWGLIKRGSSVVPSTST